MYKMLFNTGVLPYNHCDKQGKLTTNKFDVWKNGTLHIEYYLKEKPLDNYKLDYLQDSDKVELYQIAIPVIGSGMLSKYAIFTILK